MSRWIETKNELPPMAIRPEGSDPDMEYTWTIDVEALGLSPDYGKVYFDHDGGAWYWSDFSGGPDYAPTHWRIPESNTGAKE